MKLALVFCIVGGLNSCSLQQGRLIQAGWIPNNFQQARLPFYYFADQEAELDHQFYELPSNDVQKRPVVSPFFKSSKHPQSRLFGFLLNNQPKNSLIPTVTFTSTTTSVSTSVSTITTLALQNCISAANFKAVDGAAAGVLSTAACSRKKRSIELDALEPSKVIPMEASRMARNDDAQNSDPYVLSSSFLDLQEESDVATQRQVGFPSIIPKSILVITSTSTTTSFFFVASTVKKPFNLVAAAALTCLPPGFVVC